MTEEFNPEDMPIIEGLNLTHCKEFKMDNIEKFVSLGGKFEVGAEDTYLIYNNHSMRIPNIYFKSTGKEYQEVLDYYLDMLPRIGEQSSVVLPKEFGFEFINKGETK